MLSQRTPITILSSHSTQCLTVIPDLIRYILNQGHIGIRFTVPYREVVLIPELTDVCFSCPLYRGYCPFVRGSTVIATYFFAVTVRWQLHFEFLIAQGSGKDMLQCATPSSGFSGSNATTWKGMRSITMDTMTWDLPVNILPTSPDQAEPLTQQKQHVIKL